MGTRDQTIGEARRRVAENLRRLRKDRGLSQEVMAELADFHRTYVSQLERCVTNISLDGLERLANALHVDVLDLLARIESSGPDGDGYFCPTPKKVKSGDRQFLNLIHRLGPVRLVGVKSRQRIDINHRCLVTEFEFPK